MSWYLRSLCERDTHHGELRKGVTVVALCGDTARPAPDPAQNRPQCYRAAIGGAR